MENEKLEAYRKTVALLFIFFSSTYLIWRLNTLNPDALLFSIALYGAELFGFLMTLNFVYTTWTLKKRKAPPPPPGLKVDVFVPTLNEDIEILRKTLIGCKNIRYPHKTYVLDDGNREEVKKLAEELGIGYISRKDNKHAKAGNLNNALKYTDGDFIAVFDADHVPEPDFLDKTLGYFTDEKVAFVQTPQDFYNIDSFQHKEKNGKVWAEPNLFFRVILPGKDRFNAAFFCGSCAVLRRKALEDIGGFATGTVTEDIHTSIRLHAKGWKSVYHNEPLAYGLSPSTYKPFFTQRERWGVGAIQLFFSKDNPLIKKGLTFNQRISYFFSIVHFFDGLQKFIYYIAPVIVLTMHIYPIYGRSIYEFLTYFIPHFVFSIWAVIEMSRGYGKLSFFEQYNAVKFVLLAKYIISALKLNRIPFKVTDKSNTGRTNPSELIPQIAVVILSILGVTVALLNFKNLPYKDLYIANIFWAVVNSSFILGFIIWSFKKIQRRKEFRFPVNFPAVLVNGNPTAVVVNDLSTGGASVISTRYTSPGEKVNLRLIYKAERITVEGKVLRVQKEEDTGMYRIGLMFENLSTELKDKITIFNFRFAVLKLMHDASTPFHTPISLMYDLFKGKLFRRKKDRYRIKIPGIILLDGKFIPFATEDMSEGGMKIVTHTRLPENLKKVSFMINKREYPRSATVVWEEELDFYGMKVYRYGLKYEGVLVTSMEKDKLVTAVRSML